MNVVLYSTGCPQCKVLESKLKQKGVDYKEITDMDIMTEKGYMSVPILEVDNISMIFKQAVDWINKQ